MIDEIELIPVHVALARPRVPGDIAGLPWFASVMWFQPAVTAWGTFVMVGLVPPLGPVLLSKS